MLLLGGDDGLFQGDLQGWGRGDAGTLGLVADDLARDGIDAYLEDMVAGGDDPHVVVHGVILVAVEIGIEGDAARMDLERGVDGLFDADLDVLRCGDVTDVGSKAGAGASQQGCSDQRVQGVTVHETPLGKILKQVRPERVTNRIMTRAGNGKKFKTNPEAYVGYVRSVTM